MKTLNSFFYLIRSNLVNPKQKNSSQIQQSSSQSVLFIEPSISDNLNIENNSRSLLGK